MKEPRLTEEEARQVEAQHYVEGEELDGGMDPEQLARAAAYFSEREGFLGYQLAASGKTPAELCELLGCDLPTLWHLALCLAPRDRADVEELAEAFGVEADRLEELTRG
jgi:hypothetical protein